MNSKQLEPKAQAALTYLHENAALHGQARAQAEHLDDWLKVELARIKGAVVGVNSDAERTQIALAHPDYRKALEAKKIAAEIHYTNVYKRDAANAFVGAWQTACANERKLP